MTMSELSVLLKSRREELNISIEEISKNAKIPIQYLVQIENGEFNLLPSYAHAYGFVKKYAEYVSINFEEIKPIFDDVCKKSSYMNSVIENKATPIKFDNHPYYNKWKIIAAAIFTLLFIISIVYYFFFYDTSYEDSKTDNFTEYIPAPAAPEPVHNYSIDNQTDNISKNDNVSKAVDNVSVTSDNASAHSVKLSFYGTCWVDVRTDNGTEMVFTAKSGELREIKFKKHFIIDIGDGAALAISYKEQRIQGLAGSKESVKNLKFYIDNNTLVYSKVIN